MYHPQQLAIAFARVHGAAMYHPQLQRVVVHALYRRPLIDGMPTGTGQSSCFPLQGEEPM